MRRRKRGCLGRLIRLAVILFILIWAVRAVGSRVFPMPYRESVMAASEKYNVSPALLYALMKAESGFDPRAESKSGAKGLMQLMEETADWCAEKTGLSGYNIYAPEDNIRLGAYYVSYLLSMYGGNEKNAVAAYNAGHGKVDEWLKSHKYSADGETLSEVPYAETDRYILKIGFYKKVYEKRWEAKK